MYFDNITNSELNKYPKPIISSFSITLTDILESPLFNVETVISNSIYRIFPLFNCKLIYSSNPNDIIFENYLILCNKQENEETHFTFLSTDERTIIMDYNIDFQPYKIGDVLSDNSYNTIVSLIRKNNPISHNLRIGNNTIETDYGNYYFEFNGVILDNGIQINDLTTLKCKLSNKQFMYSKYTLILTVLRLKNPKINDFEEGQIDTVIELNIPLENDIWTNIDTRELEIGDIILYDSILQITHDMPIIPDWVKNVDVDANPFIIQTGDNCVLSATCYDINGVPVKSGHVLEFFEEYTPKLILNSTKNIIQSGDTDNINIKLVDEADGNIVSLNGLTVRLYEEYEPVLNLSSNNSIIQSGGTSNIKITLKDSSDGNIISLDGLTVRIYEEYNPNISLSANPSIIQSEDTSVISATVKDDDGNLIVGETVEFYIDE